MLKEPTIHQIEELLRAFRIQGGTDAEISALAHDIIRDYRPDKIRTPEQVFEKEKHESIGKIFDFKNDGKKPIHQALSNVWRRWYIKYPIMFIGIFGIIFAVANLPLYLAKTKSLDYKKEVVSATELKKSEAAKSAPLEAGEVIPAISTLVIPKTGVTAPIIMVNSTEEADIQAGLKNGVVHYFQTAEPGKVGNSFITGHSSNYWWDKGAYNYVFANLDKLVVGDQARIYHNGNKFLYQVTAVKVVEPTAMEVLDQTIKPTLTLMTCTPPGTSWKRLIVSFDQIAPVYKPSLVVKKDSAAADKATDKTQGNVLPKSDSNPVIDWIINFFAFSN
jgi:LPXTG-site transpeptidase (sortase) family protein